MTILILGNSFFNYSKPTFTTAPKKGLAAKKIDNFDLDSLTLEENTDLNVKTNFMATNGTKKEDPGFGTFGGSENGNGNSVKEVSSKTGYTTTAPSTQDEAETLKKFSNAKAISSDAFKSKE